MSTNKKAPQPSANHLHLAYLKQVSDLLEDKQLSQAARLGYIAKQICEKHVIHIKGQDSPKLRRCKACQAPIKCDNLLLDKQKKLVKKCPLCELKRRYSVHERPANRESEEEKRKTHTK